MANQKMELTTVEMHVLHKFGYKQGTLEAGSFIKSLIETITLADHLNRRKLHIAFPHYADAVNAMTTGKDIENNKHDLIAKYHKEHGDLNG
jgi:hypothetical protein